MFGGIRKCMCAWKKADKNRRMMVSVTIGLLFIGLILLGWDYYSSKVEIEEGLKRNSYGEGDRTEELKVKVEGKEPTELEVEVSEQQYTENEVKQLFKRCISKLEEKILGENTSYDQIQTDMNLVTELSGEEVDITWELDRYDVMNVHGELQADKLDKGGTLVNLRATLTYRENQEKQAVYECTVMIYPKKLGKDEKIKSQLLKEIQKIDEESKTKERLLLPEKVDGSRARYYYKMNQRGAVLIIMALLIGILLYALEKQNQEKEQQKRKQQMILDYPEIINKLTLLLGAGMIVKRAWKKIVDDYEEQKSIDGIRYAYEEMRLTCNEMESGISEAESYERFGRRCDLQVYMKLGALLSQNLRKGTRGLCQMLKLEAMQAFEERKANAKRMGEEAGTKLLVPMFLMLTVVLVIVIIPAFLSIQI